MVLHAIQHIPTLGALSLLSNGSAQERFQENVIYALSWLNSEGK